MTANQYDRLYAIHEAIWIRDNAHLVSKGVLIEKIQNLARYNLFSNRQISKISGGVLSPPAISNIVKKENKTGGRFAPESLNDLALVLFSTERGQPDYTAVRRALDSGTSQNMITRLTGLRQPAISRKFGRSNG